MNISLYEELTKILPQEQIFCDEPMSGHTTFRIGGNADFYIRPNEHQLADVLKLAGEKQIPVTIIGNGSNLLVSDSGIRGIVIEIGKTMDYIRMDGDTLRIGAGTLLSKIANFAADNELGGFEFAAGIPGSIGGAVVMNAGAYGGEMKDILVGVEVMNRMGEHRSLSVEELDLRYRHSVLMDTEDIVLSATIRLRQDNATSIRDKMAELKARRMEKQPLEYPSAGSTFKRPQGYFAGKLIEDAGLRGYQVGGARISDKHCGFVINCGGATSADVCQLILDVQDKVYEQFQVRLEPEVHMIGE